MLDLLFSDLRLKTIACYIPAENITNTPCSLGQAALNADVNIALDEIPVRERPLETAPVAFTLERGGEVRVVARSKAEGYVIRTGIATTESGTVCSPLDRECLDAQAAAELAIETQDERDWWQVETPDGETGWIPNDTFFMADGSDIYEESLASGEVIGTISDGDQVRLIQRERESWYQIETQDGLVGWVTEEPRQLNIFVSPTDLTIYDDQSTDSESVGELANNAEATMLRNQPLQWSEVETADIFRLDKRRTTCYRILCARQRNNTS